MSIKRRGNSYEVRWRRDGIQHSRSFARKEDAESYELEQKRSRQLGAHALAAPSRETLDSWLDEWWAANSILWAEATRQHRLASLKNWIRPTLDSVRLRDLGHARVAEWRAGIVQKGARPRTANFALQTLSAALTAAVDANRLPANPCHRVKRVPQQRPTRRALTPLEVEKIRAAMPAARDRLFVSLLCYAGLRPGEAIGLAWDAVSEHVLLVDTSYSYGQRRDTKTGHARTVELVEPLRQDLAEYRPAKPERGALVLPNRDGGYLDLHVWRRRVWTPACEAAGVKASPYSGRHSYASLLIHEGRSLPFVAASMGHSSASTTLEHYAHSFEVARHGTAVTMVDAITNARRAVRKTCATDEPRRLRQAAPGA
jgi:integrase